MSSADAINATAVTIEAIEDLQLQIEELLISDIERDGLYLLAQRLDITESNWFYQNKLKVVNLIRKQIEGDIEGTDDLNENKKIVITVLKTINEVMSDLDAKFEATKSTENAKVEAKTKDDVDDKTTVKQQIQK